MEKKYSQLESHLCSKGFESIKMTFNEIESVIEDSLPASARKHRAWWSNNPNNSVITYAWLAAGYKTSAVNMESETLVFRRTGKPLAVPSPKGTPPSASESPSIYGCMKGMITIQDGYDLTQPTAPEWGTLDD
jgi:hypothetical protein